MRRETRPTQKPLTIPKGQRIEYTVEGDLFGDKIVTVKMAKFSMTNEQYEEMFLENSLTNTR